MKSQSSPFARRNKPLNANMNVVPYIDVMLVLLVIFMVTAPMLSTGVQVDLPKEHTNSLKQTKQLPIIISMTSSGELFMTYELRRVSDGKRMAQADLPVDKDTLVTQLNTLQQFVNQQDSQPLQVMVNADQHNPYGNIMAIMAAIQQAGIINVGLLTNATSNQEP